MKDQVVLVTGATGQVGWGVAHKVIELGGNVILPTRSLDKFDELKAEFGFNAGIPLHADLNTEKGLFKIVEAIEEFGFLNHVIAPIGSWWQKGSSLSQSPKELTSLLDTYVVSQFKLLQATARYLNNSVGSYTIVTGAAGEFVLPESHLLVLAVKSQYAFSEVIRNELVNESLRINELRISARIEREARPGVIQSKEAAEKFIDLMQSTIRGEIIKFIM